MPSRPVRSWAASSASGCGLGRSDGFEEAPQPAPASLHMRRVHAAASMKVGKRNQVWLQGRDAKSAAQGAQQTNKSRAERTREEVQTKHRARAMSLLRAGYDHREANDPLNRAAATIQRAVRTQLLGGKHSMHAERLHCKHLAERLLYGTARGCQGFRLRAKAPAQINRVRFVLRKRFVHVSQEFPATRQE